MPYRDDAAALFARVQSLEAELARMRAGADRRADPAPAGPLAPSTPRTVHWIAALVERLPAGEQALVADLVALLVTRHDYPSLDGVSAEALEPLITRLRGAWSRPARPASS